MKKITIATKDILHNLSIIRDMCSSSRLIAVLKGNGYGLGVTQMYHLLAENGVDFFAVSELWEAQALRNEGYNGDLLLLPSLSSPHEVERVIELNAIPTIGSFDALNAYNTAACNAGKRIEAHIKVETGFGRYGFSNSEIDTLCGMLSDCLNIEIGGIYSHFSNAFSKNTQSTEQQLTKFNAAVCRFSENGITAPLLHIANSCAALTYPESHLNAVRIGSALLGRLPLLDDFGLRRVAMLTSVVSHIQRLPEGHNISYGNTYQTRAPSAIAVIPVGYSDGFGVQIANDVFRFKDVIRYAINALRSINRKQYVRISGKPYPLVGRVCMCNITALVDESVNIGDIAEMQCNPLLIDSKIERQFV